LLDYIFAAMEQGNVLDLETDEVFAAQDFITRVFLKDSLKKNSPADVLESLITYAEGEGKGERAREVCALMHAPAFIEAMQDTLKKETK
jgi:hypothetical protein